MRPRRSRRCTAQGAIREATTTVRRSLPALLLDLRVLTCSCVGGKLRGASSRDAHGADIPPVRPADGAAADDLSQSTDILPPPHAPAWTAGVLHELLSGSVLRAVLRRVLWVRVCAGLVLSDELAILTVHGAQDHRGAVVAERGEGGSSCEGSCREKRKKCTIIATTHPRGYDAQRPAYVCFLSSCRTL